MCRHVTASGQKAHAMLPPEYVQGATRPIPSPTYTYRPCGTGIPGEQPPVHIVYMAAMGTVLPSPQRFCIGEAPATKWSFDDVPVPWILLKGYRNPDETAPDFPGDDNQAEGSPGKGSGTVPGGPMATSENDKEDDDDEGFETVDDGDEDTDGKVVLKVSMKEVAKPESSGLTGVDRLFESDDEEEDSELQEQIATAFITADTIDELKLSETSSSSGSGSSDSDDDNADPNETKQYLQDQEAEGMEKSGSGPATTTEPPAVPADSGNPGGPGPDVEPEQDPPSKATGTKGKGPNSEKSGKAAAPKLQFSTSAEGVWERAQSTLFGGAALVQAMGSEEDVTRHLENYTGLLDGLQKLVGVMARGYEDAMEDIRSLVASTLDTATKRDRAFVAGASQALAEWTTTYQQAMSQGENRSIPDQLARWDRVREAGIALSRQVTSLTTEHKQSTVSGEIFRTLLPACFERVRIRTEATFSELNASLPALLCRFVTPDQAGHILASLFTCMCNYNTEICGMAMAQTVVPVYTIPNTYRVQQSLWESLCRIIPGIARTSGSELRSTQLPVPNNTPVEQPGIILGAGDSRDPGATVIRAGSQLAPASQTSCKKRTSREKQQGEIPLGIPLAGSTWVASSEFQNLPVINLTSDDNPPAARPQDTSTPIKATPITGRRVSGGKINVSRVNAAHLLWKMEDHQEIAQQRAEVEDQAVASDRTSSQEWGSGSGLPYGLPATLPNLLGEEGIPAKPSDPAPTAPKQGKKRTHDDDNDEITELPTGDDPVVPPKKKKRKKSKDKAKEEVSHLEVPDDGACPGSSSAKPEEAVEPTPAADPSGVLDEETEQPKKKKKKKKDKKDPDLEKFRLLEREAKKWLESYTGNSSETRTSGRSGITGRKFPRSSWTPLMGPTTASSCWRSWKRKAII